MPKIRTHKGTAKRFKVTATGKVVGRHSQQSHMLEKKSAKRKRAFTGDKVVVAKTEAKTIKKIAPYL
ncbi:MAG: 50S ribosomal protein L35 [Candidatus Dormibacteria bacterium]